MPTSAFLPRPPAPGPRSPLRSWYRRDLAGEDPFLFLVDDDARRHHDHQALRLAAIADVLEEAADVWDLTEDRRTELVAAFRERFQAAQEHRAAVGHVDGGAHGDGL